MIAGVNWSSIEVQVKQSSDDAENSGSPSLTNWDLDFYERDVAIRFTELGIPIGATIQYAYIELFSNSGKDASITIPVLGELTPDAPTFSSGATIDSRIRTSATVNGQPESWSSSKTYRTPDVSDIVQEIVSTGGWAMGNAMAFIFEECDPSVVGVCESTDKRSAYSVDGRLHDAARLVVYFSGPASDATPPSTPATLIGSAVAAPVDLVWSAALDADSGIGGYRIYRGDSPGNAIWLADVSPGLTFTDTGPALMREYYDALLADLSSGRNFVEVIATGAKHAAVARAYDHDDNIYHNSVMEFDGNDDFGREFFQLFFRLQGETEDPEYHEDTSIEHNSHLLTGMKVDRQTNAYGSDNDNDWYIAPIDFTDHVDGFGRYLYNQTHHHANCLEILHETICGSNAAEKIDNLAPVAADHVESLDNLPLTIINVFADDNLTPAKSTAIQASWRQANFDLLEFLRSYAISTTFHSDDTYKYRSSFDRALTLLNLVVLDNNEAFNGLNVSDSTEHWLSHQGQSAFSPAHDVFGAQTGLQAANNPNIFQESFKFQVDHNLQHDDKNTYDDDSSGATETTWCKNWGGSIPTSPGGGYRVSDVADWLWERLVADGGEKYTAVYSWGKMQQAF
jgi:hypothetical protein